MKKYIYTQKTLKKIPTIMSHKQKKLQKILENKSDNKERTKLNKVIVNVKNTASLNINTSKPIEKKNISKANKTFKKYNDKELGDDMLDAFKTPLDKLPDKAMHNKDGDFM